MVSHRVLNNKQQIFSNWLNDYIVNLNDSTFAIPQNYQYDLMEVSERYIARPDILSYDIFGDEMYADLICKLNGISNPFELNKGMLLIIPSIDSTMNFIMEIDHKTSDNSNDDVNKPKPKKKTDKRAPNEAIIGDTRFKIDRNRGIIIY